jgi:hypothetical protein
LTPSHVHRARLAAQLLSGPRARTAEDVVRRLLAVQGQDPRGARLAIRSRSVDLTAADVDTALTNGTLLISWLNRGTLHLVTPEDYWWLHPLTTPQLKTGNLRRLAQEGVSPAQSERGAEIVAAAVAEGPRPRAELRAALDAGGVPTEGQALVHVLLAATLRGHVVRGPMRGKEHAFVAVRDWLGDPPQLPDRDELLARLARRYLAGHGPADARDLARWEGTGLGEARRGLTALGDELEPAGQELVDLADRSAPPRLPPPRLLGAFDPLLLGWVSRAAVIGEHHHVVTSNGMFHPVALVGGRAVATWGVADGVLTVSTLEPMLPAAHKALRTEARDVLRFLGLPDRPLVIRSG